MAAASLDAVVSLAKRRGFVFQSSEIYGGLNGVWDFGPLGVELLRNLKEAWWQAMTLREDIEGLDAAILMHPRVWEASGHVAQFSDPMVDNRVSKMRYRADALIEDYIGRLYAEGRTEEAQYWEGRLRRASEARDYHAIIVEARIPDPVSGTCEWTEVRHFNLMFKTFFGPVEDDGSIVYLRPETAQGIYVNFLNVLQTRRRKIPFGIAQIGKAFRNEVTTKNFLFRTREFEQMEMQYFVKPGTEQEWFDYWLQERYRWYRALGIPEEQLRIRPHEKLAHYAAAAVDIEFLFPFGWGELEGIHSRTDYDLRRHQEYSGKRLEYVDPVTRESYIPYVVETSAGATRSFLAFLCSAYDEEIPPGRGTTERRTVLRLHPALAPVKAAVFPLVNRDGMPEVAQKLYRELRRYLRVEYDDSGAIGRRYRRQDEIGTPFCITIDGQTLRDETVTVRDRDTMEQVRIPLNQVLAYLHERIQLPVP
ncbi:MAG: glycine--tRNA ligase [Candidatus Kapabacteria bacterium]|nr:glycine--tRNA ligase [Candidatus Kapabacteria bacterium]MDW8011834.1 glycine--tRNA ligase [Bacteroidota bacterium]